MLRIKYNDYSKKLVKNTLSRTGGIANGLAGAESRAGSQVISNSHRKRTASSLILLAIATRH